MRKCSQHLLIDSGLADTLWRIRLYCGEDSHVDAARDVAKTSTRATAVLSSTRQSAILPAVDEIGMIAIASFITVSKDEWLGTVHGLFTVRVKATSIPIDFHEDAWKGIWVCRIIACTLIRALGGESNMRLVIRRVKVLAVPAAREVDLGPDATGASLGGQLIVAGAYAVEVQADESDSLLSKAACIVGSQIRVTTQHAEVIREDDEIFGQW